MNPRILAIVASAVLLTAVLVCVRPRRPTTALDVPAAQAESVPIVHPRAGIAGTPELSNRSVAFPTPNAGPGPSTSAVTNWLQALLAGGDVPQLPSTVIENWLASGRTNAEDFLAVRQAGGGREFLHRALTNFPNDPRVLFAASALEDSSEERRARLDRFKAAALDNALPNYLSARDHLKNGRREEAIADLVAAGAKTRFDDYMVDAIQNTEELYLAGGKSAVEAKAYACSTALLPHLAQLKGLAQDMAAMQRECLAAGDGASAEQLSRLGLQLGQQLLGGEGSRTILNQLVGVSIDRISLNPLDSDKYYDFLGGTPRERIAQLDGRRAAVKEDSQFLDRWMRNATDAEMISYFDRFKLYGEAGAMTWLRQHHGSPQPD